MSDDRLLGELIAFRRYTEEQLHELKADVKEVKKDVKSFGNWKIKVSTLAAVVAAVVGYLLKG